MDFPRNKMFARAGRSLGDFLPRCISRFVCTANIQAPFPRGERQLLFRVVSFRPLLLIGFPCATASNLLARLCKCNQDLKAMMSGFNRLGFSQ